LLDWSAFLLLFDEKKTSKELPRASPASLEPPLGQARSLR